MGNRNKKKPVEKFKSRKELRKDKRLQKKANRVHFQKRKKELKLEFKERQRQKALGKTAANGKSNMMKLPKEFDKSNDRKNSDMDDDGDGDDIDVDPHDDDEEIESDFELSDQELEQKTKSMTKQSSTQTASKKPASTQLELDHQRLKKQEQLLRKDMGKQRIKQLKLANEDEDKTIHRLEKLLKIDKSKSKSKTKKRGIPKMFNDGLDYALEMCLPENIEKMYAAAKEAADAEQQQSDSEWQEDFAMATGDDIDEMQSSSASAKSKMNNSKKSTAKDSSVNNEKVRKRYDRLREIEAKYFGDELASDLSEMDSEFERSGDEDEAESLSDNEEDLGSGADDDDDDDDDDSAPEEIGTITKSSKKRQLEKQNRKSTTSHQDDDDEDEDDDDDEEMNDSHMDSNSDMMDSESGEQSDENAEDDSEMDEQKPEIWEDIYGRKRDKDGNVINEHGNERVMGATPANTDGKYIPPHQRARLAAAEASKTGAASAENEMDPKRIEKLMRLKRLLKGQLNRLSEANMHKIATELDNLYMQNSRHDMNTTLSTLICDALISPSLAPERMVMEHSMLIAALHANVGTEVGANLLERLVDRFHQMIGTGIEQYDVEDKTLDNIVFVLCHMYTFKIFHHRLIYELLNKLIENFCEKSVECILLALRSVGFSLRKDDPAALKELIINIQKRTSEASDSLKSNARLKYMLDVLTAIKNNNVNRIPNYDPTLAEHLRKILKTVCVNGKYVNTLNISLDDLLNVQMRGKWWVVGSAWTGNVDDIGVASAAADKMHQTTKTEQKFSEQLLELARKQRMNTDERRNIFCILMSAEDYIDAFEKILHLAIKDHRVAVSVIIHCCLSEKQYNPYYAVVAQKFCDYDRKYQLAIQYAIWDRIKDIQSHTNSQIGNLAQFLNHLITNGALAISVLKIIEFGELEKSTLRLVRKVLLSILLGNEDICKEVFQRVAPSTQLKAFKDSIRLFMHHFLLKGGAKNGIAADKMQLLKERIKIADKSLDTATIRF